MKLRMICLNNKLKQKDLFVVILFNFESERADMNLGFFLQVHLNNFGLKFVGGGWKAGLQLQKVLTLGQVLHLEEIRKREWEDRLYLRRVTSGLDLHA